MNYYIKGDAAKAEQIKAAFESKGFDVGTNSCAQKGLYFTFDGKVCYTDDYVYPRDMMLKRFIKNNPDYKELELPVEPKFKVGDWIACDDDSFTLSIKSVKYGNYYFHQCASLPIKDIDEHYHLWSMADAKDGDILHHSCTASNGTFIFKGVNESGKIFCYCDYDSEDHFCLGEYHHIPHSPESKFLHPATQEQRDLLFAKMKEAGYEWDADKKELRKIQPHYDIANFKPKQWVLVRDDDEWEWALTRFSHLSNGSASLFVCINGASFQQCIPFEGNEKLLGTSDMCDEQYKNW